MTDLDRDFDGPDALGDLLDMWRDALQDEIHTATAGEVVSYDRSTERADIRLGVRRTLYRDDGSPVAEELPVLRSVRVVQPRAGGFSMHMPLSAGDGVLVIVPERDLSRWLATGEVSSAPDTRLHHIAHSVAIPGLFPRTTPPAETPPEAAMVIGTEDGTARITLAADGTATVEAGTIKLGGPAASAGVARLGDAVEVTVPIGAFTDDNGDQSPTVAVTLSGTIAAASAKVSAE